MPCKTTSRNVLLIGTLAILWASHGQELSPREQFKQYVSDLQKNPSDDRLREKIIELALTLDPKPAVPSEVQEYLGRGGQAFEKAKAAIANGKAEEAKQQLSNAADAFAKASLLAPWVADYYNDLASVQDAAKDYPDALKNYQFYVEATTDKAEAERARQRIDALKYELVKQQHQEEERLTASQNEAGWTDGAQWCDRELCIEVRGHEV